MAYGTLATAVESRGKGPKVAEGVGLEWVSRNEEWTIGDGRIESAI